MCLDSLNSVALMSEVGIVTVHRCFIRSSWQSPMPGTFAFIFSLITSMNRGRPISIVKC